MSINLLPPKYKPKPLLVWKRLIKTIFVSFLVFSLFYSGVLYYLYRTSLDATQANLQNNIDNLQPVYLKISDYESLMETAEEIEKLSQKIGKAKQVWSDILFDIAGSLTNEIWFVQISKEEDRVIMKGKAQSFNSIGNFAVAVRGFSWAEQVDINYSDIIKTPDDDNKINVFELPQSSKGDLYEAFKNSNSITIAESVDFVITAFLSENIELFIKSEGGESSD